MYAATHRHGNHIFLIIFSPIYYLYLAKIEKSTLKLEKYWKQISVYELYTRKDEFSQVHSVNGRLRAQLIVFRYIYTFCEDAVHSGFDCTVKSLRSSRARS